MSDAAPALSDATRLALDRTRLAHERTMLAWVRTATSLISFGFTIYKFFDYLKSGVQLGGFGPRRFAMVMITLGIVALCLATIEHHRNRVAIRALYGPLPFSGSALLAGLISVMGLLGLLVVVFRQ